MGKQEDIFAEGEGDAWFNRNFWKMQDEEAHDPVFAIMKQSVLPSHGRGVLEFGCSNGWRLENLRNYYGWECCGLDPSAVAISNGQARFPNIHIDRGTVTGHPYQANAFSLIIYGFCLYVCDPEEHFEIATQGNNILQDGGYIIIHDFDPEFPHSVPNKHVDGLLTYKMDWSQLWLANPAYKLVAKNAMPDGTAVWLLKKDQKAAFPCLSEFSDSAPSAQDTPAT
jgi:SAM-dependent methyltransferase